MADKIRFLLRLREVQARTGLSRTSIYECIAAGTFPAPVKIAVRSVAWDSLAVDAWIAEKIGRAA
jgi:prophage regulatory protein